MKKYDKVKLNATGLNVYFRPGRRKDWSKAQGVILWDMRDDATRCAVVWDGNESEQYVLKAHLEVIE